MAPGLLSTMDLACVSLGVPRGKLSWRATLMPGHRHLISALVNRDAELSTLFSNNLFPLSSPWYH